MRTILTAAVLAASLGVSPLAAQGPRLQFGGQVSYGNDSEFGIGGRLKYSLRGMFPTAPLSAHATVDIFFPGNSVTWIEANYNVVYDFTIPSSPKVAPYAGGGLNFVHVDVGNVSDNRFGLNLVAGMGFRSSGPVMPFVEVRGTISGSEQFLIAGGVLF